MLTVEQTVRYARSLARRYGYPDTEEIESLALYSLGLGMARAKTETRPVKYENTYLTTFIRRAVKDYMKKKEPITVENLPDPAYDPITRIEEEIEALKLTSFERMVLDLRLEGHNDNDIAKLLGKNHVFIFRVRQKIQKKYEKEHYDPTLRVAA